MATRLAAKLFGCYRASEANDPDVFMTAAAAILATYPESIASLVTDPVSGLPSQSKWLPSIAEVREACEKLMAPVYAERKRENLRRKTLAGRDSGSSAPIGSPEHERVVEGFNRLRADLGPVKELTPEARLKRLDELAEEYARTPLPVNTKEMGKYLDGMVEASRPPATEDNG